MIIISFEILLILFFILSICADSLMISTTLWISSHWFAVEIGVYFSFLFIVLIEVIPTIKKHCKSLVFWFAIWNILRSIVAAKYFLFLLCDLACNYSSWGFGEKILSMLGIQVMIIPLFAYVLFEIIIDKMGGISYKSVLIGSLLGIVGTMLGALLFI